jgi:tol-pal system protein YbgF
VKQYRTTMRMTMRHPWFLAAALGAAAFASGVQAQGRLSLSERLARLEQQAAGQGQGQTTVELLNRINELQAEVQSLRGLVEQQTFEIENLKKAQRDRYVDLDSRLSRLEGGAGTSLAPPAPVEAIAPQPGQLTAEPLEPAQVPPAPADAFQPAPESASIDASQAPVPPAPGGDDEKRVYDDAFAALRDGRYAESARRFQGFLEQFPEGELADNALYWLGESYYVTQNYRIALETFENLLSRFPDSAKAPDALLKIGYCHYELKDWPQAEAVLSDVVRRYPDQTVGKLAQGRLRALRLEGQR